jgi:phage shock protein C
MELKRRLYRSGSDRMVAGVAGGLAEYLDFDPAILRIVWVLALFATGPVALALYLVCALVIPREPDSIRVI